ncbi:unnamed protein product [Lactuca saligna]|uniref:Uncharacterized protein n=1 Tax=Lactuca saligna TaxID=75948 RepID=A0AA36EFL9_LACSI|nr:unnamed protein product [Lactuca saligna]
MSTRGNSWFIDCHPNNITLKNKNITVPGYFLALIQITYLRALPDHYPPKISEPHLLGGFAIESTTTKKKKIRPNPPFPSNHFFKATPTKLKCNCNCDNIFIFIFALQLLSLFLFDNFLPNRQA